MIKDWVFEGNVRADLIVHFGRAYNAHFLGRGQLCTEEFVDTGLAPESAHFLIVDEPFDRLACGTWEEFERQSLSAEQMEEGDRSRPLEKWQDFRRDGRLAVQAPHPALGRSLRSSFVAGGSWHRFCGSKHPTRLPAATKRKQTP